MGTINLLIIGEPFQNAMPLDTHESTKPSSVQVP